jgi:hypothetical protein
MHYRSLILILLLASCATTAQPLPKLEYLPPADFAAYLTDNVAIIRTAGVDGCIKSNNGFGLVVDSGGRNSGVTLAVPHHVVDTKACTDRPDISVIFCGADTIHAAHILDIHPELDLAFVSVSAPESAGFRSKTVAARVGAQDGMWLIGLNRQCERQDHGTWVREGVNETFIVSEDLLGGSSGGALFTERGIVGMALKSTGEQNQTVGLRIATIRQKLVDQNLQARNLDESNNLPPASRDGVRETYVDVVGDYVFNAEQVFDFFSKGWYSADNLRQIVPMYNDAYLLFDSQSQIIQPYIHTYWPDLSGDADEAVAMVRETHFLVRELNTDINSIKRSKNPTEMLQPRLDELQKPLARLQAAHKNILEQLNEKN